MKRTAATSPPADEGAWPDEQWAKKFPAIVSYLSDGKWDDGGVRELSSLSFKFQGGLVLASLNDQEGKRSLYRAGGSVQEALQSLEKALNDSSAEWRSWNAKTRKK